LVTGGGSGIGRASAILLARHGARVAVADRNLAGAQETCARITAAGGKALALEVEITDSAAVDRVVAATVDAFGRLDVLVHCPGILKIAPIVETTDEDWRRILAVNLDGAFYASRAAARVMLQQGGGRIILISSGKGTTGQPRNAAYASSKGGLNAFTLSLAHEVAEHNVLVNAIDPGQTETPLQQSVPRELHRTKTAPGKRLGQPEEVAEMVLFLATNTAGIKGQIYPVRLPS
jgi:NAD(P)-dependent dehydrogenase (short-subunit alcohol dehydrogenase family)